MGRATLPLLRRCPLSDISIHALRGEGDKTLQAVLNLTFLFQSTPSVGRATQKRRRTAWKYPYFNPRPPWGGRPIRPTPQDHMPCYFNPRPPWGGRPCFRSRSRGLMYISIHALRGEGDKKLLKFLQVLLLFQSTPSVGRATALFNHLPKTRTNFNPRPPWGGRR